MSFSFSGFDTKLKGTSYFCSMEIHDLGEEMNQKSDEVVLLRYEKDCHHEGLILICVALEGKTRASDYMTQDSRR